MPAVAAAHQKADEKRPNIVLFVADDLGIDDTGAYGNRIIRTPNVDRLAAEGLTFTRAFVASPVCVPSRSAFYTGLMPFRNGAHANHTITRAGTRSLPHYLKDLGYRVALAGKVHVQPPAVFSFETVTGGNVPEPGTNGGLRMDLETGAVDRWLGSVGKEQPFCLVAAAHSPHVIWVDPPEYDPAKVDAPATHVDTPELRRARARYYTDVTKMDTQLGAVLASLRRHGLAKNTWSSSPQTTGPSGPSRSGASTTRGFARR